MRDRAENVAKEIKNIVEGCADFLYNKDSH